MKNFFTLYLSIVVFVFSCSESGFNGGNRGDENSTEAPDAGGNDETNPDECIEGDRINLNYPPVIEECVNQSKIFDFSTDTCIDTVAANFDCNFEALANSVAAIGVPNSSILSAQEGGALLISCAEKNEGKTIIAQWIYQGSYDKCDFEKIESIKITTACYKLYLEGEALPTDTPEQRNAAVQACLKE